MDSSLDDIFADKAMNQTNQSSNANQNDPTTNNKTTTTTTNKKNQIPSVNDLVNDHDEVIMMNTSQINRTTSMINDLNENRGGNENNQPDLVFPTSTAQDSVNVDSGDQYTTWARYIMYIVLFIYGSFGLLIMGNNARFQHQERLLTEIVQLKMAEKTMQTIFTIEVVLLLWTPIVGFISFWKKRYNLFIIFAILTVFTFIWTIIALKYSLQSYEQMKSNVINRTYTNNLIVKNIAEYDWFDVRNSSTDFVNKLQIEYRCCGGMNGYKDWEEKKPEKVPFGAFPISCCPPKFLEPFIINWCEYAEVENLPNCPEAFTEHLVKNQQIFSAMNYLLGESLLVQLLSIVVFAKLIANQRKLYVSR